MSVQRIAARYAKSLIDLAKENNSLDSVKGDVEGFLKALENRDFYLLLKSPIVSESKKESIISEIFEGKMQKLSLDFVKIILRKGRESYLPEIAEEFLSQYKELHKVTSVLLTTATPLGPEGLKQIEGKLRDAGLVTDNIEIETKVDADIVGGFVVKIGDKLIDNSVAYKLKEMSSALLS